MSLKKQTFSANEIQVFDEAIIYLRGEYWQMRMWLQQEKKYARFSLRTRSRDTAFDKAKRYYHELMAQQLSGKSYFSKTTKQGVEEYLAQRAKDVDAGIIVKGRYGTIKTHLEHWLDFIGRDTKLKELDRIDCENYYHTRSRPTKNISVSQSTLLNEQSTINAMISWLFKKKEVYIEAFDFTKFKKIDKGDDALRRSIFTEEEIQAIAIALNKRTKITKAEIADANELNRVVIAYYFLISIITGLRKGEQLQLCWSDITSMEKNVQGQAGNLHSLVKIRVRAETTKVRRTRVFVVKDVEYFDALFNLMQPLYNKANKGKVGAKHFGNTLVFSVDGEAQLTARALGFHFDKVLDLAGIANRNSRDLVPYSFRHFFITDMINKGASPTQVAETCGTSTHQIEQTYYHTTEAKMITNALPQFDYRDGLLIPK